MYAIVETGGKQYRVKPGDTLAVEKLTGEPGEILDLDRVLLIAGNSESETRVGSPGVAGAVVRAEVLAHFRGNKIIIFRYKSKVRYRRKTGHRQSLTRLRITDILVDGASTTYVGHEESDTTTTTTLPSGMVGELAAQESASAVSHEASEHVAITTPPSGMVGKLAAEESASAETPDATVVGEPVAILTPHSGMVGELAAEESASAETPEATVVGEPVATTTLPSETVGKRAARDDAPAETSTAVGEADSPLEDNEATASAEQEA